MPHLRFLPLMLLALPVAELYLLIRAGAVLGFFHTLIWILVTATIGFRLLQSRRWAIWQPLQLSVSQGEHPTGDLLDSAIVMIGALLLIVPGFITDLLGLLCLIPASRRRLATYLEQHGDILLKPPYRQPHGTHTIEGEFRRDE